MDGLDLDDLKLQVFREREVLEECHAGRGPGILRICKWEHANRIPANREKATKVLVVDVQDSVAGREDPGQ